MQLRRRHFVGMVLMSAASAVAPSAWAGPPRPKPATKLLSRQSSAQGMTALMALDGAPFPEPNSVYADPSVHCFVPTGFRVPKSRRIDMVVHLHGHMTTAARAMSAHRLREQLVESRQNAILVVPQGPVNAADGHFGKLMKAGGLSVLLHEVLRELSRLPGIVEEAAPGRIILSAHSGGYRAAAACLANKLDVREVLLFDALYGEWETFGRWLAEAPQVRKLVSYTVGGRPRELSRKLCAWLSSRGVATVEEGALRRVTRRTLTKARAAFLQGQVAHGAATYEEHALRDCLLASCLRGHGTQKWHEAGDRQRAS